MESTAQNADLSALKIDRSRKAGPPGRKKRWLHLLWLLVPAILYFLYVYTLREVTPAVKVRTGRVQLSTGSKASVEVVATGYVVAQISADVSSKATGRLRKLYVEEGDNVKSGEIIAELENDDIKAERDMANANLKRVRADSVEAVLNLARQKLLLEKENISREAFDFAQAAYLRAAANVEGMKASVRAAEVALENTVIRAPFDGTVLAKHADVGEMVAPFASATSSRGAVATLADMSSLEVEADVSESNINKVTIDMPCEIVLDAYPDVKFAGYVKKIVPTADRTRATVMTKIAFRALDSRVLPEMSARVNFLPQNFEDNPGEGATIKTIAKDALTTRNEQIVAFVVVNGIVQEKPVGKGRELGDEVELLSGLETGDEVVLSPAGGLKTGDKVEVIR